MHPAPTILKSLPLYAQDINTNDWHDKHWSLKAPKLAVMHARGPGCFDSTFYSKQNPDLAANNWQPWELWEHYISLGQFEGRNARYGVILGGGEAMSMCRSQSRGGHVLLCFGLLLCVALVCVAVFICSPTCALSGFHVIGQWGEPT